MPVDPAAAIEVTAYRSPPSFARGRIKDVRVRWALEEIGLPYRERLIDGIFAEKSPEYLADQPFGQVPVYKEAGLTLFESGAILIHLGEKDARLLPLDAAARSRAIGWMIAALNSVEPMLQTLVILNVTAGEQDWKDAALNAARPFATKRLAQLSEALGAQDWLEGGFSIGDLVMADVLRVADQSLLAVHPNLISYVERAVQRPAFVRAMDAHLVTFADQILPND